MDQKTNQLLEDIKKQVEEIAKKIKLSSDKIEKINFWMSSTTSSLDAPIGEDSENQISDLVEDQNATPPDAKIEHMLDRERVDNLLEVMTDREREILDLRFGLTDTKPQTLAVVAKKLGVSRERIRQIGGKLLLVMEKHILEKLKSRLKSLI